MDECESFAELGFLFDSNHARSLKEIFIDDLKISFKFIDEEPGHVQSGQHLWPAAFELSTCCKKLWGESIFQGNSICVVELGAGCGVAGLTCALSGAKAVFLTDYDPGSLQLLKENAIINGYIEKPDSKLLFLNNKFICVSDVEWGKKSSFEVLLMTETSSIGNPAYERVVVIGSDLIYADSVIRPLFQSVRISWEELSSFSAASVRYLFVLAFSFDPGESAKCIIDTVIKENRWSVSRIMVDISSDTGYIISSYSNSIAACPSIIGIWLFEEFR